MAGADKVMNHLWLLVCGTFVMFMQAGFAMLEAGTCRVQNVQSILLKNLMDVCVGTVAWYVMGWSLAYGGDTQTPESWKDGTFEECDMEETPGAVGTATQTMASSAARFIGLEWVSLAAGRML